MLKKTRYNFLLQQYKNNVYSYSLFMLKNKMDAEDVTQEVLIKVWENIEKFSLLAAKAWILRTTHNLCIDYLRKRKAFSMREVEINEEFMEFTASEELESNPYLKTHIKMITASIKEAIEQLPENLRSVFVLYELQGLKYKEISKALNIPLNSVKVYLLRARKRLQEELKHYEAQEII